MAQEWYGDRDESDVVVSLVRSSTAFTRETRTISLDQGSTAADGEGGRNTIGSKRKRDTELEKDIVQEVSLADLHLHSSRLRSCSKYFSVCLSERWAKDTLTEGPSKSVHLSLDVHTKVKYYKDCFSRMYSPFQKIRSIRHCLRLLQVAAQISYEELVANCVCYLAGVPWSQDDEKRIRRFAQSPYYPSDCAADLSARLELHLSNTERYKTLFDLTQDALRKYFASALGDGTEDARTRFDAVFHKLIEGPCCSGILQGFLKHVNDEVEKAICHAIEDAKDQRRERFRGYYCTHYIDNIRWVLRFLLETGCAKDLVELIVEGPKLSDCLKSLSEIEGSGYSSAIFEWIVVIQKIFEEVIAGHLLLKASTRSLLFRRWSWILKFGCTPKGYDRKKEIEEIVSKFIMTFPLDKQKEFISNWEDFYWEDHYDYNWPVQVSWVVNLQRSLVSLEAQQARQSTAQRAGEYTGQSSATPSESSSVPASPSTSE